MTSLITQGQVFMVRHLPTKFKLNRSYGLGGVCDRNTFGRITFLERIELDLGPDIYRSVPVHEVNDYFTISHMESALHDRYPATLCL